MRLLTQCQSLWPLAVRRALASSRAEAAVHPAAAPGHLMTLVPRAGRRHRRSSLLTRVQSSALAVGVAHALYRITGPESDEVISRGTLQEALVAHVACAGKPRCQEGVSPGAQDVDRALP